MEIVKQLHSFITGSRKYGSPRADSDLDLVVFMEGVDVALLGSVADMTPQGFTEDGVEYDSRFGWPFRFGKLNVIVCTKPEQWQVWQDGTASLHYLAKHKGKAVDREFAVSVFQALADATGLAVTRV